MKSNWNITYFKPDRAGVVITDDGVSFAAELLTQEESGVILYDCEGKKQRFPFSDKGRCGSLYGIRIEGKGITDYAYNYYKGEQEMTDVYARGILGLEKWGACTSKMRKTYGRLVYSDFNWQDDASLMTPVEDSIIYGLNVRAFTMHKSSGVKKRGTFEGVIEKIPYLKELGITAVELMPCYEYEECMLPEEIMSDISSSALHALKDVIPANGTRQDKIRLNCWGFQNGFYFAPKASYSASPFPEHSFKAMVRELHKNGIEVILQFYFPPEIKQLYMLEVIKFWVKEYHIDGVRISGFHIPCRLLAEEPILKNTKIWCAYLPEEDMDIIANPVFKNFMADNGNYRYDMRRYLKGDEGMMNQVLYYQRRNPKEYGVVNYFADYDGYSLYDCVSYERKHNEENGENNRDGNNTNFTWNCGVEGDTRKKIILELRLKQLKNAFTLLLTSQGIPFIFSGDEFANSRKGNNNCYCQDNDNGWINWKKNRFSSEILAYTRFLIHLRKSHQILHMKHELQAMDSKGCGSPDISYHGVEAWRPDLSYISHMAGIVLSGQYATDGKDTSFYIAYNMHWEAHKLALPNLPKDEIWVKIADTSIPYEEQQQENNVVQKEKDSVLIINERSIMIYQTKKSESKIPGRKRAGGRKSVKERQQNL